ncbi:MAG: DUF4160 domain-containing protein [Candidatus Aegiribacteria sp.]|nr:DUF4160 domain-containing protein [Candidatus Aegiribacteria sp.]
MNDYLKNVEELQRRLSIVGLLEDFIDTRVIMPDGRMYIWKARVASVKDLTIDVYPHDHDPPHFHVRSCQRGIDARFDLSTIELINEKRNRIRSKDIRIIQFFFRKWPDMLEKLKEEYARMHE